MPRRTQIFLTTDTPEMHMSQTALQGNPVSLSGDLPAVGSTAPDFTLVDKDLADKTLAD